MSQRVLVIDDSRAILAAARHVLSDGFVVETTDNPLLVPSLVTSFKPDWILLDFEMPTINGKDVLSAIKNTNMISMSKIIMFSTSEHAAELVSTYGLAGNVGKDLSNAKRLMSTT